jgi:hypothetical protein
MNSARRLEAINTMREFMDCPAADADRELHDAELLLEGGLLALDNKLLTKAGHMLRRAQRLAEEAFAAFLRTDIATATHVHEILGRIEEGLRDLEGMQ